jgi:hypothetical protein
MAEGMQGPRAGLYRSHIEPDCATFFKSMDKLGGPVYPDLSFDEIYCELYIKSESYDSDENTLANELTIEQGEKREKNMQQLETRASEFRLHPMFPKLFKYS